MGRFTNPRDLYFGEGARHEVKNLKGKRAVIVSGGSSMRRGGFLDDVENDLKSAGFEVAHIEGVESDPSVETVMSGAAKMSEFQPDWIIAIGGGSPIDAAKAMWIKYEYPETTFEDMCKVFGLPELRTKAHFCAISSTSGTATEVTAFSIITDYQKGVKYPIADFQITPDIAIVDPELTYGMPVKLVAHTGMDALTHAIEAYVSTVASMYTDGDALHAIREIVEWLPKSYNGDKRHVSTCMTHSALLVLHSLLASWALFTLWLTRPAQHSPVVTSFTVAQTLCTWARSFSSTLATSVQKLAMHSLLRRSCTSRATLRTSW